MRGVVLVAAVVACACTADARRGGRSAGVDVSIDLPGAVLRAPEIDRWPDPVAPAPGTWVQIGAATFAMGAAEGEVCYRGVNQARHEVTLTRAFEIMDAEVTQADYAAVMGSNPATFTECGPDCPVERMSWHQAAEYCNALSDVGALPTCYACDGSGDRTRCVEAIEPYACAGYRLPTEAEWELAYRAGEDTPIHGGTISNCGGLDPALSRISWFLYNAGGHTHPVRSLEPNAWGLFDMSGNVWEWAHDGYALFDGAPAIDPSGAATADDVRVMRGGSYNCVPEENRAAHRSGLPATIAGSNVGMRCARTLGP